jgi:hypothetical protein
MLATVVETKEMLQTVVVSLVAGVGVTFIFSIAIWGTARFAELSRDERPFAAGAAAALAIAGFLATVAAIVIGVIVMTNK